jgi:hypothetical protein
MHPELEHLQTMDRGEAELKTGLTYGSDTPVVIRVHKQDGRYSLDDDGAAVRLSGTPEGWREIASGLVAAHGLDIDHRGVVFVPAAAGRDVDAVALSVADTSLSLYAALRDPGLEVGFDSDTSVE